MALRSAIWAVFLASFLPSASPESANNAKKLPPFEVPDISMFVGTPEPIWTYCTSRPTNMTCKVDVMVNMSRSSIKFNRSYEYPYDKSTKKRYASYVTGVFDMEKSSYNVMYLFAKGIYGNVREFLEFMSKDYSCALIRVLLLFGGTHYYEVRVRNSSITTSSKEECLQEFRKKLESNYTLYSDDCQNIFHLPLGWYDLPIWPEKKKS